MAKREAHHAAHPLADDPSDRRREPVHLIDLLEIDDALLKLSADLLDSISLRFYVGLTSKEAAEMLNISPGAFNNRVHRAIEILRREWLGPDGR
jgi:DNA-directed RNA polymerase specialized sigma24 family protein